MPNHNDTTTATETEAGQSEEYDTCGKRRMQSQLFMDFSTTSSGRVDTKVHARHHDSKVLESKTSDNTDGRAWVTDDGHGEVCRTASCHSQIDIRHVLRDGSCVTLCADCRATYPSGSSA